MNRIQKSPLVSILCPTYNNERYIQQAIESILKQTYPYWELLIWNDGSTDKTLNKILAYAKDSRIQIFSSPHLGSNVHQLTHIHNYLTYRAKGEYICEFGGAWLYHKEKLKKQVSYLQSHPDYSLVHCNMNNIDQYGTLLKRFSYPHPHYETGAILYRYLFQNFISCPTTMMTKSKRLELSGYDPGAFFMADYELWGRVLESSLVGYIHEALVEYRIFSHSQSLQSHCKQLTEQIDIPQHTARLHKRMTLEQLLAPIPIDTLTTDEIIQYRLSIAELLLHRKCYYQAFKEYETLLLSVPNIPEAFQENIQEKLRFTLTNLDKLDSLNTEVPLIQKLQKQLLQEKQDLKEPLEQSIHPVKAPSAMTFICSKTDILVESPLFQTLIQTLKKSYPLQIQAMTVNHNLIEGIDVQLWKKSSPASLQICCDLIAYRLLPPSPQQLLILDTSWFHFPASHLFEYASAPLLKKIYTHKINQRVPILNNDMSLKPYLPDATCISPYIPTHQARANDNSIETLVFVCNIFREINLEQLKRWAHQLTIEQKGKYIQFCSSSSDVLKALNQTNSQLLSSFSHWSNLILKTKKLLYIQPGNPAPLLAYYAHNQGCETIQIDTLSTWSESIKSSLPIKPLQKHKQYTDDIKQYANWIEHYWKSSNRLTQNGYTEN